MRAMVVAHPDDETLWGAGLVLQRQDDWTIYACSIPKRDPIRALRFYDACKVLGARGVVLPFVEKPNALDGLEHLDLSCFEEIVTHNSVGEYGHEHHKQVNRHIIDKYGRYKRVMVFGHGLPGAMSFELTPHQQEQKRAALQCYNHVLPYNGRMMTKCDALIDRYAVDFRRESYVFATK